MPSTVAQRVPRSAETVSRVPVKSATTADSASAETMPVRLARAMQHVRARALASTDRMPTAPAIATRTVRAARAPTAGPLAATAAPQTVPMSPTSLVTLKEGALLDPNDPLSVDPTTSGIVVHGDILTLAILLPGGGTETFTVGKEKDGKIPAVIRAGNLNLPRLPVQTLACACLRGLELKTCGGTLNDSNGAPSTDCTDAFTAGPAACAGKKACAAVFGPGNVGTLFAGCNSLDGANLTVTQNSGGVGAWRSTGRDLERHRPSRLRCPTNRTVARVRHRHLLRQRSGLWRGRGVLHQRRLAVVERHRAARNLGHRLGDGHDQRCERRRHAGHRSLLRDGHPVNRAAPSAAGMRPAARWPGRSRSSTPRPSATSW